MFGCLFGHKWKEVDRHASCVYAADRPNSRPIDHETIFLLKCSSCGKVQSKKVKGYFPLAESDEDDRRDDETAPKQPICPDDYFETLETQFGDKK